MTPTTDARARHDAVVLAGGRATRLGGVPKPTVVLDGATLLDRALAATRDAARTVVVGPDLRADVPRDVLVGREDPPFGGPVAGLDAGLRVLDGPRDDAPPPWVLVLAVDVPRAADAVPLLRAAVHHDALRHRADVDGAYLVHEGRAQWLVGLYRRDALRRELDALAGAGGTQPTPGLAGVPVRRLVARLSCVEVPDADAVSADVDTWDDARRLTVGLHDVVTARAAASPATDRATPAGAPPRPQTHRRGGTR